MNYLLDENGFVVNGFFAGSRRKVTAVCVFLGIDTNRVVRQKGPKIRLQVGSADRVTPTVMQAAEARFQD
jgi:hypothetical protein